MDELLMEQPTWRHPSETTVKQLYDSDLPENLFVSMLYHIFILTIVFPTIHVPPNPRLFNALFNK
jgi:hypothetical protein